MAKTAVFKATGWSLVVASALRSLVVASALVPLPLGFTPSRCCRACTSSANPTRHASMKMTEQHGTNKNTERESVSDGVCLHACLRENYNLTFHGGSRTLNRAFMAPNRAFRRIAHMHNYIGHFGAKAILAASAQSRVKK